MVGGATKLQSDGRGVTLHVHVLKRNNDHHRAEAAFRTLAVVERSMSESAAAKEDVKKYRTWLPGDW